MSDFPPPSKPEWAMTLIIAGLAALLTAISLAVPGNAQASHKRCTVAHNITAKHHRTTVAQRWNTTQALRVSTRMGSPFKHQVALVAAATQEDKLRNRPRGHGTSVGYLQLIDIHGSVWWRMQVPNSAGWFLRGARQVDRSHYSAGTLAQKVQRSAHPYAYHQWVGEATRTVKGYRASCR